MTLNFDFNTQESSQIIKSYEANNKPKLIRISSANDFFGGDVRKSFELRCRQTDGSYYIHAAIGQQDDIIDANEDVISFIVRYMATCSAPEALPETYTPKKDEDGEDEFPFQILKELVNVGCRSKLRFSMIGNYIRAEYREKNSLLVLRLTPSEEVRTYLVEQKLANF